MLSKKKYNKTLAREVYTQTIIQKLRVVGVCYIEGSGERAPTKQLLSHIIASITEIIYIFVIATVLERNSCDFRLLTLL
jgi:hypothetical protein